MLTRWRPSTRRKRPYLPHERRLTFYLGQRRTGLCSALRSVYLCGCGCGCACACGCSSCIPLLERAGEKLFWLSWRNSCRISKGSRWNFYVRVHFLSADLPLVEAHEEEEKRTKCLYSRQNCWVPFFWNNQEAHPRCWSESCSCDEPHSSGLHRRLSKLPIHHTLAPWKHFCIVSVAFCGSERAKSPC